MKPRASSAHGSSVQPLARSKRAWCQWQVSRPASTDPRWSGNPRCGQRSSIAQALPSCHSTTTGSEPTFVEQASLAPEIVEPPGQHSPAVAVAAAPDRCIHRDGHRACPQAFVVVSRSVRLRYSRGRGQWSRACFGNQARLRAVAPLTDAKRRIIDRLKRVDTATAPELAEEFGLTDTAVRQHLEALEENGLVERAPSPPPVGPGPAAGALAAHAARRRAVPRPPRRPHRRADRLDPRGPGRRRPRQGAGRPLHEPAGRLHEGAPRSRPRRRCRSGCAAWPTSAAPRATWPRSATARTAASCSSSTTARCATAASACQGLCRSELELFKAALGDDVTVERVQHLLSGDQRCAYRITRVRDG